jgi:hypothetical protein
MNHVSGPKFQQSLSTHDSNCTNDQQFHRQIFQNAKAILKKIERLEAKIQSFHQEDQRLFKEWEQAVFHEKRLQLASLQNRCYVLTHFHNRILATSRLLKVSISSAYQILKDEEEVFETGSEQTRALLKRTWAERDQFANEEVAKAAETTMHQKTRKADSKKIKDKENAFIQASPFLGVQLPWENPREELRLTYRKLVRKLHPDSMAMISWSSAANMEWMSRYWHQAQDAYQARDQATLGKLYFMTLIHLQEVSSMTLAEIKDTANWLQQYYEILQTKADVFKRSRAWGFSKRKTYQPLIKAITKDLSKQMAPLDKQIQYLDFYHKMLEGGRKPLAVLQKWADSQVRRRRRCPSVHANQTSFLEFLS